MHPVRRRQGSFQGLDAQALDMGDGSDDVAELPLRYVGSDPWVQEPQVPFYVLLIASDDLDFT
jgi:hypothetical protein